MTILSAFEWGGLFTDGSKLITTDFKKDNLFLQHTDEVALWCNAPVISDGSVYFAGQVSYKNTVDYNLDFKTSISNIINLDLMKIAGKTEIGTSVISASIGRYGVSDLTGKIFNQTSDGILVKSTFTAFELSLYAGFTGTLNALSTQMINLSEAEMDSNKLYVTAHQYVPVSLAVEFPSLFLNQTLNLQVNLFKDLEKTDYNRYYATVGLNGPIAGPLYYSLIAAGETEDYKKYSVYGLFSLQTFISSVVTFKAGVEYASGDQFGLKPFTGFTSYTPYSSLYASEFAGMILPSVDMIFTGGNVYFGINSKLVLDYPEDLVTVNGVSTGANFIWNIFSDVRFGLSGYYFVDINHKGNLNNMAATANISLAF